MTEEEKYINQLFKAAKEEAPKRSFKSVATHFEKTIGTAPVPTSWTNGYFKYFSLNSLLMISVGSFLIAGFLWMTPSTIEQTAPLTEKAETPVIDQKMEEQEKVIPTLPPINNQLLKKDRQANKISIPKEKLNTKANLTNKREQKKEISAIEPPKKIGQPINTVAKVAKVKEIIIPPASNPSPKEKVATSTPFTTPSKAISDSTAPTSKKIKLPRANAQLLQLKYTDDEKTATTFLEQIRSYGFSLTEKVNRNSGNIERIHLNISLYRGLDWKIKLRNFEIFELKILLDEYKNPVGLAYRLSQTGKFSEVIALNSRARSTHKFSKAGNKGSHTFTKSFTKSN